MSKEPNYFAIIPSIVRYDRLKPNEKLLYGEISALANKMGICFAQNSYFAELYNKEPETISRWITNLEKCGYIKRIMKYKKGTKEIDKRGIVINGTIKTGDFNFFSPRSQNEALPDWFGKDIEENLATEEEIEELNELLGTD